MLLTKMSPQTRTSANGLKKMNGKPTLSQLERHISLERGKRVCIVCGQLSPICSSVVYPKGRQRRKEFDTALNIPSYVSDALPAGCYICNLHFNPAELEISTGIGPAQLSEFAIPSLDLDHEFLRELCSLKKEELEPKSAVRLVKSKLDWDMKPPLLIEQENSCESDESQESNTPNALVSSLFGKNNKSIKQLTKRRSDSPKSPPAKTIRLVPVSAQNRPMSQTPPVLEKMGESMDDDQPPTLSPVTRKSQRVKMPVLEASSLLTTLSPPIPSTSKAPTESEKKDQLIQRLKQSLTERTTELALLKKKLKITEELLQFYQNNPRSSDYDNEIEDLPPLLSAGQNSFNSTVQASDGQATAMVTEGSQTELLQRLLKGEPSDQ